MGEGSTVDLEVEFEARRIRGYRALLEKRRSEALKLALINIDLVTGAGLEHLLGLAHSDVARTFGVTGDLRNAMVHLQESLQRTSESDYGRYGSLLNNLGNVYMNLDRPEEAAACFVRARKAFRKIDNDLQVALTLSNEGRALARLGQLELATSLQQEALALYEKVDSGHLVAATLYKLAENLAEHGDEEQAEQTFKRALSRIAGGDADGYEDDVRVAYGQFLNASGRPDEAAVQFDKALELVKEGGISHRIASLLKSVAAAHEAAGDVNAALYTYKELLQLRDRMDLEPARAGNQTELVELELALERETELMQATGSALEEANERLAATSRELTELALTDYLTGLHNRRHFGTKLAAAVSDSRSSGEVFTVIFLDVDNFKAVNDGWGHETGDLVLQQLSRLFRQAARETDVIARWGGEEFAFLLPFTDGRVALAVAETIRLTVNRYDWSRFGAGLHVTVSAGLISSGDHPGLSAEDVLSLADVFLYRAKHSGRNRVMDSVDRLKG